MAANYQNTCRTCDDLFTASDYRTKYCSDECKYKEYSCEHCNIVFLKRDYVKRARKYCSKQCSSAARRAKRGICPTCHIQLSADKYARQKYCSVPCAVRGGRKLHKPVGATLSHNMGYILIKVPEGTPGAGKDNWMLEHRYIFQEYHNQILAPSEKVFHKNSIRNDNRIENLTL